MKTLLSLAVLLYCFSSQLSSQTTCVPADERLSVNQLNTSVNPLYLWWDKNDPQFNYPNGSPVNAVFAGGLWLTALYPNGEILSSVTEYGAAIDRYDYQAGPTGTGGSFSASTYFCRSFKVTKGQVDAHLADLADGTLDQPIAEIIEWPGRDNALLPTSAMSRNLAPFVDINSDGVYQPESGDYPDFRADEAIWWVTNDFGPHLASDADLVGAEVQVLAQAFAAPNHPASKAQLYTVKVINKADVTLDSLGLSLWVDPDVGCPTDDAVGSLPSRNAIFAYNIDAVDGTNGAACDRGISTYANLPPTVFFQTISSELNGDPANVRNSGISMNNSQGGSVQTSDPNVSSEYFNLAHGRWSDGAPMTVGGNGYGGTEPTNWIFSGVPEASGNPWSECDDAQGLDRRILLNVNINDPFAPEDEFTVDFLVSVVREEQTYPCPDHNEFIPVLDSIVDYVQNTVVSSNRNPRQSFKELTLKPNPARDIFSIQGANDAELVSASLYDALGKVVGQFDGLEITRSISVSHLPRGTYSLVARDVKGELYRSRVVLQ